MAHTGRKDAPELPDFSMLKRLAKDQLVYLLEQLPGRKDLFIDADLMSPLDRIANVTTLKQHEVDKLYKVELKPIVSVSDQLCFLIRPRIQTVKWITDIVNSDKASGRFRRYKIIFTPQKFYACDTVLEEQGVYGDVTSDEWAFYLLPLDDDIISLELPEFFRDYFLAASEHFVLKVDVLEAGKMGKCKDLSEFDKGQIVMARRLDQSISKTAAHVGSAVDFKDLLLTFWCQIPQHTFRDLVESMPRREGDQRWVTSAGSALHLLHSLYGPFSKVYGIGRCAKMVYESWREQVEDGEQKAQQPEIGNVFLIDRDVDFVTPLCSQVVYEGLVDDIFRIKCGCVEFGPEVTSTDKSIKVMLNSQDKVFNEIRNEHFSNVFGFLSQKARSLQTAYDKRRGMDIKQMKTFVSEELKGLKQEHRLLTLHIGASESIMKRKTKQDFQELLKTEHSLLEDFEVRECIGFIEEHINRQVSMIESLRLLCLLSLTENGLLPKDYRSLKAQYLQSYGTEHLLTFANLKEMGLLVEQQPGEALTAVESKVGKLVNDKTAGKLTDAFSSLAKKSNFRALSKKLMLIPKTVEEYDLRVPRDMAYIFSGAYIPLSCKLIEQVLERDGWTGLEEVTRLLNGHEFAVTGGISGTEARIKTDPQMIILVMFLGGCTFSEMSALRFIGREKGYKFIVVTTAITNSSRLLEALLEYQA